MAKPDPLETLVRKNCAKLQAEKATAPKDKPPMMPFSGRRSYPTSSGDFKCKTCGRTFSSFQALGGHVSSHTKHSFANEVRPRVAEVGSGSGAAAFAATAADPNAYDCTKSEISFSSGQALGGHLKMHADLNAKRKRVDADDGESVLPADAEVTDVGTASSAGASGKKKGLLFDLNLPPVDDEDDDEETD